MPGSSKINKKLVWRVQNSEGQGPYTSCSEWWRTRSHVDYIHPTFIEDNFSPGQKRQFAYNCSGLYRYGFVSKRQALKWFSAKELKTLVTRGYRLQKVTASYMMSNRRAKQCIFIPGD